MKRYWNKFLNWLIPNRREKLLIQMVKQNQELGLYDEPLTPNKTMHWFKRKYRQIKRVIDFLPLIWDGFDFDYTYALQLFKKQLERLADELESERANTTSATINAQKIRTALRLMDKVYDDDYSFEYQCRIKELYGEDALDWEFKDTEKFDGSVYLKHKYEQWDNADEIRKMERKLFKEAQEKQKRAHKLLWDFMEHNIQGWWD